MKIREGLAVSLVSVLFFCAPAESAFAQEVGDEVPVDLFVEKTATEGAVSVPSG